MKNETTMKTAPAWKMLITMSLPVILIMIVNVIYNMADIYFISQTGDAAMIAGISLAAPVFSAISAFNTLIGFGGCTAVSMALGREDYEAVKRYSSFVVYGSVLMGLVLAGIVLAAMPVLLPFLGAAGETAVHTASYLRILAFGSPFLVLGGALGNTIRADGDSKNAMLVTLAGTLLNVILDPLFITVFHMNVSGAALATVMGNVLSTVCLLRLASKKKFFSVSIRDFSMRPEVSLHILSLGLPMAAGTLLMSFSSAFGNSIVMRYGTDVIAARSIAGKVGMLTPMIIMGIDMGIQPAISYHHGAGNHERLREIVMTTLAVSVLTASLMSVGFFFGREAFMRAFVQDSGMIEIGKRFMIGGIVSAPVCALYQMCSTWLQATGKVAKATITALLRQGIVMVPVLFLMERMLGLNGIIWSSAVTDVIAALVGGWFCLQESRIGVQKSVHVRHA